MTKDVDKLTIEAHKATSLRRTLFIESWEFSIRGKPGEKVVVRFSKESLIQCVNSRGNKRAIPLDKIDGEVMGEYLGEIISYSTNNQAKIRLTSKNPDIDGIIVEGSPLCSYGYYQLFWFLKRMGRRYGNVREFLMG